MDRRVLVIIFIVMLGVVAFLFVKNMMENPDPNRELPGADAERAASEVVPTTERDDMRPKDRAYGGAHKRHAYDNTMKAHDRTDDYLEKHADDIYASPEGGDEEEDEWDDDF